jgi:RND family efflux transporter MFP subunit
VAQATFDGAKTARDVAASALTIAQYNRQVAELVAPEDGVIEQRLAEVSELVGPGQSVYTLRAAKSGLVLRVALTDRDLLQTHVGTAAKVRLGALPGETFTGKVSELANAASPRSGTFEAEIRFDARDPRLLPGLVATAELTRTAPSLTWVPVEALVDQSGHAASVFALSEQVPPRVEKRPVEIAYLDGSRAGVSHGLQGVTQVVTDGVANCAQGGPVQFAR